VLDQAEQAFSAGNFSRAQQLVALALKQKPNDPMAGYVGRVIDRAQQIRVPEEKAQASR
jgi:hypothetical protein